MAFHWPTAKVDQNRQVGKFAEQLFQRSAGLSGMWAKKNPLSATIDYRGQPRLIESQLDFRLITKKGQVGYFDLKGYQPNKFAYSSLNPHQIKQAIEFNEWNVPAGFIVVFMSLSQVVFYSGKFIKSIGPKNSFEPEMGVNLGKIENFDLKKLFANTT